MTTSYPPTPDPRARRVGLAILAGTALVVIGIWIASARRRTGDAAVAPLSTAPTAIVEYEGEIGIAPPVGEPRRSEVAKALAIVLPEVRRCMGDSYGTVFVDLTFAPDGTVSHAAFAEKNQLRVDLLFGGDGCFMDEARKAKVPPGPPMVVSYPFRNMPSPQMMRQTAESLAKGKLPIVTATDGGT